MDSVCPTTVKFTALEAGDANDAWGFNCGPAAVAAVTGMTLDALRPHLGGFELKHYTNPTLMWEILKNLGVEFSKTTFPGAECITPRSEHWPKYGLARIQWEGPWTKPGVPIQARYRQTHWIGVSGGYVFDINAMEVGGWIPRKQWTESLVPWLLENYYPKADGNWHITHSVEVTRVA